MTINVLSVLTSSVQAGRRDQGRRTRIQLVGGTMKRKRNTIPATLARLERAAIALAEVGGGFIFDSGGMVKSSRFARRLEDVIEEHRAWLKRERVKR